MKILSLTSTVIEVAAKFTSSYTHCDGLWRTQFDTAPLRLNRSIVGEIGWDYFLEKIWLLSSISHDPPLSWILTLKASFFSFIDAPRSFAS